MGALSAARFAGPIDTGGSTEYPQKANKKIYPGAIVMVVSGYALPAAASGSGFIPGVAKLDETSDSTDLSDGDIKVCVEGSFGPMGARHYTFDNDPGGGALSATTLGTVVYALDDHSVTSTSSGNLRVGTQVGWDAVKSKPIVLLDR